MIRLQVNVQKRIAIFIGLILCFLIILCGRYAWLQLVQGGQLAERVKAQSGEQKVLQSPRGTIYDRNGRELAVSMLTKSLFVDPSNVKDGDQLAADLAPILMVSEAEIKADIAQGGGFVWIKRRLEHDEADKVQKLIDEQGLNCLGFKEESKRYYPNDMLAANVIGFVGTDDLGLDGIEQEFNSVMKGESKKQLLFTDMQARPIFDSIFSSGSFTGERCKDVYLTLDSTMQFIVEQTLDKAVIENNPRAVTAIVMNPQTGEILAMASRPSYNPNKFYDYKAVDWKNKAVSFVYEPGSTFKAVVAAAALQENLVTPQQVFVDPGYVMVSGRRIQNWSADSFGTVTFLDVVKQSINTGFVQVGLRVGAEKLTHYAKIFGFGQPTGVELPGEEQGILFDPKDMRDSDVATMSIGQSIAVTPLQLVTAMSAIANNGVLLKPHILKAVNNADGSTYAQTQTDTVRRVIDQDTDTTLVGMLEQVVASGGGSKASVKGYRIAGKTGTAQKIRDDSSGYMEGHYIASFCGFAPVENPQITVIVMIDDPSGIYYGGQIAAPIAGEIFSQLFRYLNIAPSSDPLSGQPKNAQVEGTFPATAIPMVPQGKILVPDMTGKSLRQVSDELDGLGLVMKPSGTGIAVRQSIEPNTIVDQHTELAVYFETS